MSRSIAEEVTSFQDERPTALGRRKATLQRRARAYRAVDLVTLLLSTGVAILLTPGTAGSSDLAWVVAYVVLTLVVLEARGFYSVRMHDSPLDTLARLFAATSISAMSLTFVWALTTSDPDITSSVLRIWVFSLVFLSAARLGITLDRRSALRRGEAGTNTLIIGSGRVGHRIARRLLERPELGLRPIGFLDKDPLITDVDGDPRLVVLGASWDLERVVHDNDVEHVIVTFSTAPHSVVLGLVRRCRQMGIEVVIVPRLFEEMNNRVEVEHIGGLALLRAAQIDPRGWQFGIKYAIDKVVAGLALFVVSPIFGGIALAVKLTSPGPVYYRQERVGVNGRRFDMLKFRTMTGDPETGGQADAAWAAAITGGEGSVGKVVPVRDRRTSIGKLLRGLSLDELPQLINVVRGDMSLVGPRPERTDYVEAFKGHIYRYGDRHRVRSGLTGWAQVQGLRGETSLEDRVEWDNYYIENWSLWLDLKIVLLTIPALFSYARKGG
ncbi:MAG TPA: sugar transferase [Conexibacter sp.]